MAATPSAQPAQASIVSTVPASTSPNINDGATNSLTQVGSRIIAGGSFTSVSPAGVTDGSQAAARTDVLAFDATSGVLDAGFHPVLDGTVYAVTPGPTPDTVYLGGAFSTVNGVAAKSIALVSTVTGAIVPGFTAPKMNGIVYTARLSLGRLYLGGSFTVVGGVSHEGLVTLTPATGAVDPFMAVQLTGHHNYTGKPGQANGAVGPRKLAISPDGTLAIVIGNFKEANGVVYDQIVRLRLDGATATVDSTWKTSAYTAACFAAAFDTYMEDVDFAPDGSYFAVGATGGSGTNTDGSNSLCDSVARWQTAATGSNVRPVWVDYTGNDTPSSVAVTGPAVYVGGHQRWMNNPLGADNANLGAVPRPGIAALDPVSGVPLSWNPGRNPRGAGAGALLVTSTGLWVGSDTTWIGNRLSYRGRVAFFPLAGGAPAPDYSMDQVPANAYLAGQLTTTSTTNVLYRVNAGGPTLQAIDGGPVVAGRHHEPGPVPDLGADDRNCGLPPGHRSGCQRAR